MSTISSNSGGSKMGGASKSAGAAGVNKPGGMGKNAESNKAGQANKPGDGKSIDRIGLSAEAREAGTAPKEQPGKPTDTNSLDEKISALQGQLAELKASRGEEPGAVDPADYENYRGGEAPDRTPGRFSPIDNEGYGRSSYEKEGVGGSMGTNSAFNPGHNYDNPVGGKRPSVTGGGGGGSADPNQSLEKLAEEILVGGDAKKSAQERSRLVQKCQQLASRGFQPDPNTRAVVSAALGSDPFGVKAA